MIVVVRQAGDDRGAPKIYQTSILACECLDCSIAPHSDVKVAPDGKRLLDRKLESTVMILPLWKIASGAALMLCCAVELSATSMLTVTRWLTALQTAPRKITGE
jgi:hypothetical protein